MSTAPHILVIPFPAQGHLIPLLDLTHRLLASFPGDDHPTITILITPKSLPLISPILQLSPDSAIQTLILPLPPHPSLPSRAEHVRDLPSPSSVAALIQSLSFLRPQILAWARANPNPPTSILSDFFLGWTHLLAADLSVPRFAFYTSGALVASVFDRLFAGVDLSPPLPSFRYDHLPSIYRRYEAGREEAGSGWGFVRESMALNSKAYAAVLNTFGDLESKYLDLMRESYGHDRVWAVGPISPALPGSLRGGRSSVPSEEVVAWLDACPERSVVYVCFGSQFSLGGPHARALSSALEVSGVRFIWCVGSAAGDAVAGGGFEGRTRGRGLVIRGWAPQVTILGHPSVGAFVTHCGWNSVLEGLANGTVLLTWPMEADQFVNARLVVEEMGIGVAACEGGPDVMPEVQVLARILEESVDGAKWVDVKRRAEEMRLLAAAAVAEGGSSWKDTKKFEKELREARKMT